MTPREKPKQKLKPTPERESPRGKTKGLRNAEPACRPPSGQLAPPAVNPMKGSIATSKLQVRINVLEIVDDGSRPRAEIMADSVLSTVNLNAISSLNATRRSMDKDAAASTGISAFAKVMAAKAKAVKDGDMSGPEATAVAQIVTLDCLFAELVGRAQSNFEQYLPAAEIYMRLALRAQAQCRSTIETLAEMKNPRPVFAKNFNLANGSQQVNSSEGPQQVNNGGAPRAENSESGSNKLLEQ